MFDREDGLGPWERDMMQQYQEGKDKCKDKLAKGGEERGNTLGPLR